MLLNSFFSSIFLLLFTIVPIIITISLIMAIFRIRDILERIEKQLASLTKAQSAPDLTDAHAQHKERFVIEPPEKLKV